MEHFPLFTRLKEAPCLLVGGGEVAARKARILMAAGARLTVVAPTLNAQLTAAATDGELRHVAEEFSAEHIGPNWLVVAATGERSVNRRVVAAASAAKRFCNVVDDAELSTFIMPAVVDRAPVTVAISTGGLTPVLARVLRARLEDWLPDRIGHLAEWAGRYRTTLQQKLTTLSDRQQFWERVLTGPIADHVLAGRNAEADAGLDTLLTANEQSESTGCAWLVGAGPGDPGMLTRRAAECLRLADVIFYDRLVSHEIIALARRDARLVAVGKTPGGPTTPQAEINRQLVDCVAAGQRVCRLKGGDPFIFGRGGEEIAALRNAGLDYEVVPGITAAIGCAARAGIPLTHRDFASAVTLVTGHAALDENSPDWRALADPRQTLAVYMGVRQLAPICERLIEFGRATDTPAALIENGTTDRQRVIRATLDTLPRIALEKELCPPALLLVGEVAAATDTLKQSPDLLPTGAQASIRQ